MENTLENKAKFFAQYWGQRVVRQLGLGLEEHTFLVNENILCKYDITEYYIRLKPLSSITDEDAMFINYMNEWNYEPYQVQSVKNIIINCIIYNRGAVHIHQYDYLRSKGYALPYMGLSVEKLIDYGWVKLNV